MKTITQYFRNAVLASLQGSICYRKNKFTTVTWEEIKNGKLTLRSLDSIGLLGQEVGKNSVSSKKIIIALKTIATEFLDGDTLENNIDEMTSVFFMPAQVDKEGNLSQQEDKYSWIPREYLSPMIEPEISIGRAEDLDIFLEETTDKRNLIDSWGTYLKYTIEMFEYVTKSAFFENQIMKQQIKTDGKYYVLEDEEVDAVFHLKHVYSSLISDDEPKLYNKMTNGVLEPSSLIGDCLNFKKMIYHAGQMSGEYPLSESQREAISCFEEIGEGEVLAVNGPPGTGKTTLLQSIVANMYVRAALERKRAPLIIATSTNNQAVTNIIDSFGKINPVGIKNLETRWITGVHSFAVYFPSKGKYSEARNNNYQCTDVKGMDFAEKVESEENRVQAKELFVKEFYEYFGEQIDSLHTAADYINKKLLEIEEKREKCIEYLEKLREKVKNQTTGKYILELENKIAYLSKKIQRLEDTINKKKEERERLIERSKEWRVLYNRLPWYVKLLKFIPYFKKKIRVWVWQNMNITEHAFLDREMGINEIEESYEIENQKIIKMIRDNYNKTVEMEKERERYEKMKEDISYLINKAIIIFKEFSDYDIDMDKQQLWEDVNIKILNDKLDKVRYVEFWLAVHYYEALWLAEKCKITEKQKGKTFEKVLNEMYQRLAMVAPCMVMTCYMLPKQFWAYDGNEKQNYYMYNYADLLIVDEAGQISPEIGMPAFAFAKKAIVVGDEEQIPPVWGTPRALDIAMAISSGVIKNKNDYSCIEENGLNCSQSSIMKIASRSCKFEKHGKGLFLCEHRRCYNEIVQYCNELVYEKNLRPLRGKASDDNRNVLKNYLPPMGRKQIDSKYSKRIGTSRQNSKEAEEIVEWVRLNYFVLCEKYRQNEAANQFDEKTILGIITPFKGQSAMIKSMIKRQLPEIEGNIAVGTVHTFQGAERNVIIFSSVYGSEEGCYFINSNKSLMNVAVSRAKDSFLVFGDSGCLEGNPKSAGGMLKRMTEREII